MSYADYLIQLLQPLHFYDLSEESFSGCELRTLGAAFDAANTVVSDGLKNAIPATADEESLQKMLEIMPIQPIGDLRKGLLALLQVDNNTFSLNRLNALAADLTDGALYVERGENYIRFDTPNPQTQEQCKAILQYFLPSQIRVI